MLSNQKIDRGMFIKHIVLHGFKSYGSKTVVAPFSSNMNCIVGPNGSGKSNILHALRYILSEDMYNITEAEKATVLYKGMQNVKSAYVEIVFDNSRRRLPLEADEVTIRRTLGMKDEFVINDKRASKAEVTKLFEGAGLYRSNSYFAVSGDSLVSPSSLKASEILHKLKDVAGTSLYEERRTESLRLLEETDDRLNKIQEMLQYIEERLKELEEEKTELHEWQELDRKKRSLEYSVNDRDLNEAREILENLESRREEESEKSRKLHTDMSKLKEEIEEASRVLKLLTADKVLNERKEEALEEEIGREMSNKARIDVMKKEAQDALERSVDRHGKLLREKGELEKVSRKEETQLNKIVPEYDKYVKKEAELLDKHQRILKRHQLLLDKQAKVAEVNSKEERDEWAKTEIAKLNDASKAIKSRETQLERDSNVLKRRMASAEEELRERLREGNATALREKSKAAVSELVKERHTLHERRKELWRNEDGMDTDIENLRLRIQKAESRFKSTVAKSTWAGVDLVMRIAKEKGISGVLGPIYDLFECHKSLYTAVEAAARNSIFNVVVDTDDVASEVLEELNNYDIGRVTFMPLNRLEVGERSMPSNNDVFPLISKMKYEKKVMPAMKHIFGKYLVCRDVEIAMSQALEGNINCVTLEGDQVSKGGAVTGGGRQYSSRLKFVKQKREQDSELESLEKKKIANQTEIDELERQIAALIGEIEKVERKIAELSDTSGDFMANIELLRNEMTLWDEELEKKGEEAKSLKEDLSKHQDSKKFFRELLKSEFNPDGDEYDEVEIEKLGLEAQEVKSELMKVSDRREKLEVECYEKRSRIKGNLLKQIEEIDVELGGISLEGLRKALQNAEQEEMECSKRLEALHSEKKIGELDLENTLQRLKDSEALLEEKRNGEKSLSHEIMMQAKQMDKIVNRRNNYLQKKEEIVDRIRGIGTLPTESVETFKSLSMKELLRDLKETKSALQKYEHVNKKALLQYLTFSKQRNTLVDRKEKLEGESTSIRGLIKHLDLQKDEAIVRTFNDVASHFEKIIAELVPNSNGKLRITTSDEGGVHALERASADNLRYITGVVPQVSFGGEDTDHGLSNLSGGQRALLSLAIVLAIQRCNPAPFYIFDEIDKSLDPEFRLAVANLVRSESENSQFIVITFNEEMAHAADRHYLVSFNQEMKISTINRCEKQEVIEVIDREKAQGADQAIV